MLLGLLLRAHETSQVPLETEPNALESTLDSCPPLWPRHGPERHHPPYAGGHKTDPQAYLCGSFWAYGNKCLKILPAKPAV